MSGVFEKQPVVQPNLPWGTDTSAKAYRYFFCPKCNVRHKYGHLRHGLSCFRCERWFSPDADAYRYEEHRVTSLSPSEQAEAHQDIYGMPLAQWEDKQALREQREQAHEQAQEKQRQYQQSTRYRLRCFVTRTIGRLISILNITPAKKDK